MKKLLILAIFLRVLVAAFYFHPDIKTFNFQASFLRKGVFNIYTYLIKNKENLPLKEEFVYFPLTYFTLGSYQFIAQPLLGPNFDSWLSNASSFDFVLDPNIFRYLLILKLPFLALDIWIAFLIKEFFKDKKLGEKASILWLFNPFTIFLIYAYSNIDILVVALSLVSFLLIKKDKAWQSAVILGVAAGFKLYPLLFTPFLFLSGRNLKEKLILSLVPWLVFGAICAPFLSADFIHSALISGLSTGVLKSGIAIFAISALFFYAGTFEKKINLFNYWIILFLILFSFPLYHVQWLLWVAPFLVIAVIKRPQISWIVFLLSMAAFLVPILYEDRFMTVGLLRAYSILYDLLPTPFVALQKIYDPYALRDAIHAAFAGGSILLSVVLLRKRKEIKA